MGYWDFYPPKKKGYSLFPGFRDTVPLPKSFFYSLRIFTEILFLQSPYLYRKGDCKKRIRSLFGIQSLYRNPLQSPYLFKGYGYPKGLGVVQKKRTRGSLRSPFYSRKGFGKRYGKIRGSTKKKGKSYPFGVRIRGSIR